MSVALKEITDADFQKEVLESEVPVLVDFWAPWCGPCVQVAPIVDQLAQEYVGRAKFVKINVDNNQQYSSDFQVQSIPTFILFNKGKVVQRMRGVSHQPKKDLAALVDGVL